MALRGIVIFIIALVIIRLSGRRSFGMKMPLDNVITILLGAILSRAVVGASPFLATVVTCVAIALLHRIFSGLAYYSDTFGRLVKGKEMILYDDGKLHEENLRRCMISHKDLMESIRLKANLDSLEEAERIFMERNGEIAVVLKQR